MPYEQRIADEYDAVAFLWRSYLQLFNDYIPLEKDSELLDLGCGTGSLLMAIHNKIKRGIGIDCSIPMIEKANEKVKGSNIKNLRFEVQELQGVKFDHRFDLILSTDGVLAYLPKERIISLLQNVQTLLKPGGKALLEFWTTEANAEPLEGVSSIPYCIKNLDASTIPSPFICETTQIRKIGATRYRFYFPDKSFTYTIIHRDGEDETHIHYFIRPNEVRTMMEDNGYQVVQEYGLSKKTGSLEWIEYDNLSKVWTALIQKA